MSRRLHFAPPAPPDADPIRFWLFRSDDCTGVSGTGYVAEGVVFRDGHGSFRWCCPRRPATTVIFDDWRHIEKIHGHNGKTRIVWIDESPPGVVRSGPHSRPVQTLEAA